MDYSFLAYAICIQLLNLGRSPKLFVIDHIFD